MNIETEIEKQYNNLAESLSSNLDSIYTKNININIIEDYIDEEQYKIIHRDQLNKCLKEIITYKQKMLEREENFFGYFSENFRFSNIKKNKKKIGVCTLSGALLVGSFYVVLNF